MIYDLRMTIAGGPFTRHSPLAIHQKGQSAKVNETFPENLENAAILPLKKIMYSE
jgi:hypothetical protein